ncbi:uncharacterized protein LOC121418209 [Lytechinus variegatus]|uniref:uncharacterized protein LOC121418209 n=1 Tax=Lytechinus variegatus TaxID=7654 RepID=UPI001BB1E844|nr:uncharacterized protein LOC121418209 [Lytechinus variegatus]
MGTKVKGKRRPDETEDETLKKQKKKKIFLFRLIRKRKRLSQSQEFLHDTQAQNFRIELEIDEQVENESDVEMVVEDDIEHHGPPTEDDIVGDTRSDGDHDAVDGMDEPTAKRRGADEKKRLFKFWGISFSIKKRRKKTEYSKFSESTDNILGDPHQTEQKADEDVHDRENRKKTKKTNSKRYVRFETDNDDDKENMAMSIDDGEDNEINNQSHSSSMTPKKKKKSTKKKIAKASRKTGRVFRDGMIQVGHNLQYLSPMPTPHVFADPGKKKASYTDTPKKRNYKYTAKAPPTNPYGFL